MFNAFKMRVGTDKYNLPVTGCEFKQEGKYELAYININDGAIIVGLYDPEEFPKLPICKFYYDKPYGPPVATRDSVYIWNSRIPSTSGRRKLQFQIKNTDLMEIIEYFLDKKKGENN